MEADFFSRNKIPLILGIIGVVLVGLGIFNPNLALKSSSDKKVVVTNPSQGSAKIKVDVAGAVAKPGVYELAPDQRVEDAISAAGGFSEQADSTWVNKNINLASKLTDGQKIYITSLGEQSSETNTNGENKIVNLNSASESELDSLPGIGPVTANKIIAGRPYKKIEDLTERKIVGSATFEKIKGMISVF